MIRGALTLSLLVCVLGGGCRRASQNTPSAAGPATSSAAPADATASTTPPNTGTVGPIQPDCFDIKNARPCPTDSSDPSGKGLPAHGGPCRLPLCSPCGAASALAYRDEHGTATAGYCMCVPHSDDSGTGSFSCFDTASWKRRLP